MSGGEIGLAVLAVANTLSSVLIEEYAVLGGAARHVEWIERELRSMQGRLEHEQHRFGGEQEQEHGVMKELEEIAEEAEDVIKTFIRKSVKRRRSGVLHYYDKRKVSKELEKIRQRMGDISHKIMYLNTISVETPGGSSITTTTTTTVVAPAIEKLDYILKQNSIANDVVIKIVEVVKNELHYMQKFVSNLKPPTTCEREKLWLEEVKGVCELTVEVAEEFISKRESRSVLKRGRRKFEMNMESIHTQIGDILRRWLTYGVGVGGRERDKQTPARTTPDPNLSLKHMIVEVVWLLAFSALVYFTVKFNHPVFYFVGVMLLAIPYKFAIFIKRGGRTESRTKKKKMTMTKWKKMKNKMKKIIILGILYIILYIIIICLVTIIMHKENNKEKNRIVSIVISLIPLYFMFVVWAVNLWSSMGKIWKCTKRDLAMMRAFLSEMESIAAEGLNERQKVWLGQLRVVAQNSEFLDAAYPTRGFCWCLRKIKYAPDINRLLKEILDISDRRSIYGIADIQEDSERNPSPPPPAAAAAAALTASSWPVMELKVRIQSIREEMELLKALKRDAEALVRKSGALDGRSKIWVEQMQGIAEEAVCVINDYAAKLEHRPILIYIFNFWTRLGISNKLYDIEDKIGETWRRRKAYGLVQLRTRSESMVQILRQPSFLVGKESSAASVADELLLMTQLLSDEPAGRCITCITGIGGTGKTRLASMIFHDKAVVDHFNCRLWLSLHSFSSSTLILKEIAKQATQQQQIILEGGDSNSSSSSSTFDQNQVLQTLARTKYLIVIDGMETCPYVLDTLKDAIPDMSTACRILLTSRNAKVGQHDHAASIVHPLHLLDDESSWTMFTRYLEVPLELVELGKKIVNKCGGLPSEILKMSNSLSQRVVTQEEWSAVLAQTPNWPETVDTINTNLPNYLRRCLFYSLLFPTNFEIPVRRLVALWIAEGLVVVSRAEEEEEKPQEQVAEKYLSQLIDGNVVQIAKRKRNGKVKTCRIPTALRQQLNANAKDSIKRWVADRLDERDVWHSHIHGAAGGESIRYDSPSFITNYKDVRTFMSFDTREGSKPGQEIGNFLNGCISSKCFLLVRMLDLEGVFKPKLPESIARLFQLRYLGLRWTYLDSLPSSISSLLKLQTLDLKHTYIHVLPTSIWKMELRHLFLSETFRSRFPPQPKHNTLSDLQTLWGLFVDEETPVKGGFDTLLNIRKLGLACQSMKPLNEEAMEDQLKAVVDWITKLEHLQSLRLKSRNEEGHPSHLPIVSLEKNINLTNLYLAGRLSSSSVLSQFPLSLIELTLSHSKLEDDPMQMLKFFPYLRSLCLLAESYMGKSMLCESESFPQLLVLKLWKLEQLEEWKIEEGALPCLKQLEIRSCTSLTMRPHGLEHVNTLLEVKMTNMPNEISADIRTNLPNCDIVEHNFQ